MGGREAVVGGRVEEVTQRRREREREGGSSRVMAVVAESHAASGIHQPLSPVTECRPTSHIHLLCIQRDLGPSARL